MGWFERADELGLKNECFELGVAERVFDGVAGYNGGFFGVQFGILGVTAKPSF